MKRKLTFYDEELKSYVLTDYGRGKIENAKKGCIINIIGELESQIESWQCYYDSLKRYAERGLHLDEKDET